MNKYKHEVIFCIVNAGFTDEVMDAAREVGARGGTVIRARGTANAEAEKMFNIANNQRNTIQNHANRNGYHQKFHK